MPSTSHTRRRVLQSTTAILAGLAGCSSGPSDSTTSSSPTETTEAPETTTTTDDPEEVPDIESVSVADFILYPLAGAHPHVHRRADTQYVVVQMDTSLSFDTVSEHLSLVLDDATVSLAARQPVPWEPTLDVAFAPSKDLDIDDGAIYFDEQAVYTFSDAAIERLNNPPVFEVSNPSVTPSSLESGELTTATVRFDLANTGEGPGTFGASLKGNYLSGAGTITKTLDPDTAEEVTGDVDVKGKDDEATVRLDWGTDEWSTGIPVVETASDTTTTSDSTTTASSDD